MGNKIEIVKKCVDVLDKYYQVIDTTTKDYVKIYRKLVNGTDNIITSTLLIILINDKNLELISVSIDIKGLYVLVRIIKNEVK